MCLTISTGTDIVVSTLLFGKNSFQKYKQLG